MQVEAADNLKGKTILLVNTGTHKKRFIVQRLKKLGLIVVVLNKEKNWAASYVDHWILADTFNHSEAVKAVELFIKSNPEVHIDGALTFWEDDVLLTSKIVDKFNFVGIPYDIARQTRNKYLFREFCIKNNIRAPRHHLLKGEDDIDYVCDNLRFPLVVKPAYGASSAYVVKVYNREDLANTYKFLKHNINVDLESALSDGFDIFVEEYIDGDEVDVDILIQNGKIKFYVVSDNFNKDKGIFFVDSGQTTPSTLPPQDVQTLIDMAEETLEKLGIQNGCIHYEAKSTKNGPCPLEVNLRMGGDYVYSYIKNAWGVDLIEYAVKIALGQFFKIKDPRPRQYIIGWDLHPESSGLLVELSVDESLKKEKYFQEINLYKEVGDPVLLPPEGQEHIGWLTVSGDNFLDAQDNLKKTLERIHYKVVEFDEDSFMGKTLRKDRFSAAVLNKNLLLRAAKLEKVKRVFQGDQKKIHVGIAGNVSEAHNNTEPLGKTVVKTLRARGYKVSFFDFNNVSKAFNDLHRSEVDLVFNLCEKISNSEDLKPEAAAILQSLQIPYTGSDSFVLSLCRDKIKVKKLLSYHNIPTPKWDYAYDLNDEIKDDLRFPLIVKPSTGDNLMGISNQSVVMNRGELDKQLRRIILDYHRPVVVEEYIEGDEYEVLILGSDDDDLRVLPLSRSIFKDLPEEYKHIYTHAARWGSDEAYKHIVVQRPAKNIGKKLESLITEIALDAYSILDCRDYGRVDIRVDEHDNPYVLELDPNPSLTLGAALPEVARVIGMDYGDLLEEIIGFALHRYKTKTVL
ncbi:MAG: ATP-grasp domain-containing protein [Candidatus Magasanikbacteria bacterium]|nr:ATP-grasp domain-containing protein [Candidatus Magasanikbacteria bacterium]